MFESGQRTLAGLAMVVVVGTAQAARAEVEMEGATAAVTAAEAAEETVVVARAAAQVAVARVLGALG